ncbi:sigma-70 family RNA polymerase sigma factor [Virgibacillus sp. MSP4-1]|uniref:RNA polymerase sigma factor n=1 Tax=Virgibacillus sp. MSP4-1 TaxID=2700081 RepID=UPI00039CDE73|nr:sigma-70 family RNA polymerase sigma factor [Virgibacillus sp. MSP4-1]QHS24303.1 sigma-70 family RNA polymerase sigma factor [Virgibacillus sp. MSP4-1]
MSDEKDVALAQDGDKEAFSRLIKRHQHSMYRVTKGILKAEADCADAIQEAIIKSYQSIRQVKNAKSFQSWLMRIVVNQCYDMIKKQKRVVPMESVEPVHNPPEAVPVYDLYDELHQLKSNYRMVIILYYYEQYSIEEISTILRIRIGTVKSRLNRGRRKLAEIINLNELERGNESG